MLGWIRLVFFVVGVVATIFSDTVTATTTMSAVAIFNDPISGFGYYPSTTSYTLDVPKCWNGASGRQFTFLAFFSDSGAHSSATIAYSNTNGHSVSATPLYHNVASAAFQATVGTSSTNVITVVFTADDSSVTTYTFTINVHGDTVTDVAFFPEGIVFPQTWSPGSRCSYDVSAPANYGTGITVLFFLTGSTGSAVVKMNGANAQTVSHNQLSSPFAVTPGNGNVLTIAYTDASSFVTTFTFTINVVSPPITDIAVSPSISGWSGWDGRQQQYSLWVPTSYGYSAQWLVFLINGAADNGKLQLQLNGGTAATLNHNSWSSTYTLVNGAGNYFLFTFTDSIATVTKYNITITVG